MVSGLKENKQDNLYIINADRLENNNLVDVSINIISNQNIIVKRIEAEKADVTFNDWNIKNPKIFNFDKEGNISIDSKKNMEFNSFYNVQKLNNLFKNLDTISFIELLTENKNLIVRGYEKVVISEKLILSLRSHFF